MKSRNRKLLTVALATALMSPLAFGQDGTTAQRQSTQVPQAPQVQEVPRPALPPAVTPRAPIASDPHTAVTDETVDRQSLEDPMTSSPPPPQAEADAQATSRSAASQRGVWDELDTDGDGRVSAAEATANRSFADQFETMDVDRDGYVTASEYRAPALAGQARSGGLETPPPRPSQPQGASDAAARTAAAQSDLWSRLDADGDGRISSVESSLDPDFSAEFSSTDLDSDGFVSADEYRAAQDPESKRFHGDGDIDRVDEPVSPAIDNREGGND